jgi:hypothetical protein
VEENAPRIRVLLRQAQRAQAAGKRAAAEQVYRQIVAESPATADAWVGLGQTSADPAEREAAFGRALELAPANEAALRGLGRLGDVPPAPPDAPAEVAPVAEPPVAPMPAAEHAAQAPPAALTVATEGMAPAVRPVREERRPRPAGPVEADAAGEALACANHPNRRTNLRCNRCGKPICSSCARRMPVGYRCPECVREQEDAFYTATPVDYLVVALVALPLGVVGGWIGGLVGFFAIFVGPVVGGVIGKVAFRVAGRRRGRWLPYLVATLIIVGAAVPALLSLLRVASGDLGGGVRLLFLGVYAVSAAASAFYWMK